MASLHSKESSGGGHATQNFIGPRSESAELKPFSGKRLCAGRRIRRWAAKAFPVLVLLGAVVAMALFEAPQERGAKASSSGQPFLWGVATSSYQVEGGIDCDEAPPRKPEADPALPCNDYDYFNSDPTIQSTVAYNTRPAAGLDPGSGQPRQFDLAPAGDAVNFWDPSVYERDFDNAALLGLNSFRFSLDWSRIEPTKDDFKEDAIEHYVDMVDAMRARGLTPVLSLNHFTLPSWVLTPPNNQTCLGEYCFPTDDDTEYGESLKGFENPETVNQFEEFVKKVVPYFKDKVDYWLTINEPVGSMVDLGYIAGVWSPGFVADGEKAKVVLKHLIEAHVRAYDVISFCSATNSSCDDVDADGDGVAKRVGFAHAMMSVAPDGDNAAAASNFDYFNTDFFVNAVVNGQWDENYLNSPNSEQGKDIEIRPDWQNKLDFLGINYYRRVYVHFDLLLSAHSAGFVGGSLRNDLFGESSPPHGLLNDIGWAVYPQGLYDMIMRAKNNWGLPVMITENGTAERADRNRAPHIVAYLKEVQRAMADGATVLGYMHWSLMDNWELQENYDPKAQFGLFHVDRSAPSSRAITEGALAYQEIVRLSARDDGSAGPPSPGALQVAEQKFGTISPDGQRVIAPVLTHGRFWEAQVSDGSQFIMYQTPVGGNDPNLIGMIYWKGLGQWRRFDLTRDWWEGPLYLKEAWYNDATGNEVRYHTVSNVGGTWSGSFSDGGITKTWTATPVQGAGLWQWSWPTPTGPNGTHFYISQFEGAYAGKYLTGGTPLADSHWKEFNSVELDSAGILHLNGDPLFDLDFSLAGGANGVPDRMAQAPQSGTWSASKQLVGFFGYTGYGTTVAGVPGTTVIGGPFWEGQVDGNPDREFRFGQGPPQTPYYAFTDGAGDRDLRVNDPTRVDDLDFLQIEDGYCYVDLGGVHCTPNKLSFAAAGRHFNSTCDLLFLSCAGTWSEQGIKASRVREGFPPIAEPGPSRTVEANAPGGANVTLDGSKSFDLDDVIVTYTWEGPFGVASGTSPPVFLPLGRNQVCLAVVARGGPTSSFACQNIDVVDATPPAVNCGSADGIWHANDVSIQCTASDNGSGLADPADAAFFLSTNVPAGTETDNALTDSRSVCDAAGNCATAGPIGGNKVDKKPPEVTFLQPSKAVYLTDEVSSIEYSISDGGSGPQSSSVTLDGAPAANGQVLDMFFLNPGTHTIAVTATDNLGNSGVTTRAFEVQATSASLTKNLLRAQSLGLITDADVFKGLMDKLNAAAKAHNRGQHPTEWNQLSAFIQQLLAQEGKGVDSAIALRLSAYAQDIINRQG